ncbi:hypothetical protein GCM10022297_07530 [Lactobacillus hamsteri]|nr:hypothetical protein [Lactobacillus hamsteri]
MTDKKKHENKKSEFHVINADSSLSAGICGPDGCVLDWDKVSSNKEDKKE